MGQFAKRDYKRKHTYKLNLNDLKDFNKQLNKLARNGFHRVEPNHISDMLFNICDGIGKETALGYKKAKYNGTKRVRYVQDRSVIASGTDEVFVGFSGVKGTDTYININVKPLGGGKGHREKSATGYLAYDIYVSGQLGWFLEFGSGDRFTSSVYGSKAHALNWTYNPSNREYHFISEITGLETWVYQGEIGNNYYVEDGNDDHRTPSMIAKNKYYSAGNEPSRALYKAVRHYLNNKERVSIKAIEAKIYK